MRAPRTVVAVEPAPENVESLRRTFAPEIANGRVVIEALGLWNQTGELPLRVDAANSARNSFVLEFGPAISTVVVPLRTIDSIQRGLDAYAHGFHQTGHRRSGEERHRGRHPNHGALSSASGRCHGTSA